MGTTKISAMIAECGAQPSREIPPSRGAALRTDPRLQSTGDPVEQAAPCAPFRIIGVGTAVAEGLKQGVVVDIERTAAAVKRAVSGAEQMAGLSVRS